MKNQIGPEWNPTTWAWTRKDRKIKKKNIVAEYVCDYCSHSTLHGITYLGANDITLAEKIWWLIIFLSSLCFCLYLIRETWVNWEQNPIIISFEKEQTPIWAIPFPAVTICPVNKVNQSIYNYTDLFSRRDSLPADEYKKFWDVSLACSLEMYDFEFLNSSIEITDKMAVKSIFEVAPNLRSTIYSAKWKRKGQPDILFSDHLSKDGICFTFNTLRSDEMFTSELDSGTRFINHRVKSTNWTQENGYAEQLKLDDYPRRTSQSGYAAGLSLILTEYIKDIDFVCGLPISGYKLILHNPVETAKEAQHHILVDSGKKVTIMVKPELISSPQSLKHLDVQIRQCYFSDEKSLRFYKVYTQMNCLTECFVNIMEANCGCIPFYLPRDSNTPICGFGKTNCLAKFGKKFYNSGTVKLSSNKYMKATPYKISEFCNCLPACTSLYYTSEISSTNYRIEKSLMDTGLLNSVPKEIRSGFANGTLKASHVDIFFKESQFLPLQRTQLHSQTDFIATCGGFLGLFMGFSVLSLVEIIYFLTLRLWCRVRQRKRSNEVLAGFR